jgi:alkylmercury lyase
LNPEEERLALSIYRELAKGEPIDTATLEPIVALSATQIREILEKWFGVYYDDQKRIIGFWGLAIRQMGHHFNVGSKELYTWCAWDALFIPQLIGKSATVTSKSPVSGEIIRLDVSPDKVASSTHPEAVVSILVPETLDADIQSKFCHFVYFFTSRKEGEIWIKDHPGARLMGLDEAFQLGLDKNKRQFKERFSTSNELMEKR